MKYLKFVHGKLESCTEISFKDFHKRFTHIPASKCREILKELPDVYLVSNGLDNAKFKAISTSTREYEKLGYLKVLVKESIDNIVIVTTFTLSMPSDHILAYYCIIKKKDCVKFLRTEKIKNVLN